MPKPTDEERRDMQKLILRKLVTDRRWGSNYIKMTDVPRGLDKKYPYDWYLDEVDTLIKIGVLGRYKKRDVDAVYLNLGAKKLIEDTIREN